MGRGFASSQRALPRGKKWFWPQSLMRLLDELLKSARPRAALRDFVPRDFASEGAIRSGSPNCHIGKSGLGQIDDQPTRANLSDNLPLQPGEQDNTFLRPPAIAVVV